jgi:hypothetical protein
MVFAVANPIWRNPIWRLVVYKPVFYVSLNSTHAAFVVMPQAVDFIIL